MKTTKNKARNRRIARKRAARLKYGLRDEPAMRDSMRACRRGYGLGIGK